MRKNKKEQNQSAGQAQADLLVRLSRLLPEKVLFRKADEGLEPSCPNGSRRGFHRLYRAVPEARKVRIHRHHRGIIEETGLADHKCPQIL